MYNIEYNIDNNNIKFWTGKTAMIFNFVFNFQYLAQIPKFWMWDKTF